MFTLNPQNVYFENKSTNQLSFLHTVQISLSRSNGLGKSDRLNGLFFKSVTIQKLHPLQPPAVAKGIRRGNNGTNLTSSVFDRFNK